MSCFFYDLKDENILIGGVLSQRVLPWDAELGLLRVGPMDTWIPLTVDAGLEPWDQQWF